MEARTTLPTIRRAIAIALTLLCTLALTVSAHANDVIEHPGGDHGACDDGRWIKADWGGTGWLWEPGPAWDGPAPAPPTLTVVDEDDGPMTVDWTSATTVLDVHVKAATLSGSFPGGTSGTVTGLDGHAISHIVFCYGPPPPPVVTLEKAWLTTPDAPPVAIHRESDDGWVLSLDGPDGYVPDTDFVVPDDFDLTVTYGEDTYTVTETVPAGWEAVTCSSDAPQPNGLGTFPYEEPGDDASLRAAAEQVDTGPRVIRHLVCNVEVTPVPLVPAITLDKTPQVDTVTYDAADGDDETVTYDYVVTNTGETPLTGLVLVDDVLGPVTLATTDLAVGASTTGTATHVVTADDATAGRIDNVATVTGVAPDQTEVEATADATVLVEQVLPTVLEKPGISLTKTASVELDEFGDKAVTWSSSAPDATVITYEYVLTNTGETPLTGLVLVDDVLGTIELPDTDLAVGASLTVTADHVVSASDADVGWVVNIAEVTGTAPDGTRVSAIADEEVFVTQVLPLVLEKEAAAAAEQLPVTGAASVMLALVALAALGLGGTLLVASRHRW